MILTQFMQLREKPEKKKEKNKDCNQSVLIFFQSSYAIA